MSYCGDEDWVRNEEIETLLDEMRKDWEDSPPIHLYAWLEIAHPEVFKQWQAIYEIEKED